MKKYIYLIFFNGHEHCLIDLVKRIEMYASISLLFYQNNKLNHSYSIASIVKSCMQIDPPHNERTLVS